MKTDKPDSNALAVVLQFVPQRVGAFWIMSKKSSVKVRALGLLVLIVLGAAFGLFLIWSNFGAWKDAHFQFGWRAPSDAYTASFLVFLGIFIVAVCAICISSLLRCDLRSKRKRGK